MGVSCVRLGFERDAQAQVWGWRCDSGLKSPQAVPGKMKLTGKLAEGRKRHGGKEAAKGTKEDTRWGE